MDTAGGGNRQGFFHCAIFRFIGYQLTVNKYQTEVVIAGGGLVGGSLAIALAQIKSQSYAQPHAHNGGRIALIEAIHQKVMPNPVLMTEL